ncbi:PAS domain-containing protein [Methylobacterium komagatae]
MRRVQDAVRRSDVRYRGLAESLPLLVWTMRVSDGEATYLNAQFRTYYGPIGASRAERLSRNHPDDASAMEAAWTKGLASGVGYSGQWRIRRHDGVYRWHQISISPILLDANGDILEWLGTALDVDDIVTARIAMEDARQLLGLALEAAGAGTWGLGHADRRGLPRSRQCADAWPRLSGERAAPPERRDLDGPAQSRRCRRCLERGAPVDRFAQHLRRAVPCRRPLDLRARTHGVRCRRPAGPHGRPASRHHRFQGDRGGPSLGQPRCRDGAGRSRAGKRGQEQLPRGHEPRDPHAAQQHHRLCRPAARR